MERARGRPLLGASGDAHLDRQREQARERQRRWREHHKKRTAVVQVEEVDVPAEGNGHLCKDSLEPDLCALLKECQAKRDDPPVKPNPIQTCAPPEALSPQHQTDLSKFFETIVRLDFHAHNTKDLALMTRVAHTYYSPALTVNIDSVWTNIQHGASRDDYLAIITDHWQTSPRFQCWVHDQSSLVDEDAGEATVFTTNKNYGLIPADPDLIRESTLMHRFERREAKWLMSSITIVTGGGALVKDRDFTCTAQGTEALDDTLPAECAGT